MHISAPFIMKKTKPKKKKKIAKNTLRYNSVDLADLGDHLVLINTQICIIDQKL